MKNNNQTKFLFLPIFFLFSWMTANAESNAYMHVTGGTQGLISGTNFEESIAGKEDAFEINEAHHLFQKDSAGRVTVHSFIVTTPMSKGMPFLLKAFDDSETLDPVIIRYYRPDLTTGVEENYYTILLRNAKIEHLEPIMLDNSDANNLNIPARFRIRFNYTSIEHQYSSGGVTQAHFLTN